MELLPEPYFTWLKDYGSLVIFGFLATGIIGLPLPQETLMIASGILMQQGNLYIAPTILVSYAGAICGITISYLIGAKAGYYFIKKFGSRFGLTDEKMEKMHNWFERYGKWTLFFGYFIPGIRHFTGLFAGLGRLKYYEFAIFAYSGAIIWATIFLGVGYFFGQYWITVLKYLEKYSTIAISVSVIAVAAYVVFLIFRKKSS